MAEPIITQDDDERMFDYILFWLMFETKFSKVGSYRKRRMMSRDYWENKGYENAERLIRIFEEKVTNSSVYNAFLKSVGDVPSRTVY